LKKVPRLGERTFEQAAGFLRIQDGSEPLMLLLFTLKVMLW
jgi:uncharacterized protein